MRKVAEKTRGPSGAAPGVCFIFDTEMHVAQI